MMTFTYEHAVLGDHCQAGIDAWLALLDRISRYTIREIRDVGFPDEHIYGLLIDRARRDPEGFARLRAWVTSCGGQPKATADQCAAEVARVRVLRYRQRMTEGLSRAVAKAEAVAADLARLIDAFS